MPDKIMRCYIEIVDGVTCVVFAGNGKNLCIPAKGLQAVFDDAMQRYTAFETQRGVAAGQWRPASIKEPLSWNTGTTDDGKVAVTVDRHLPTEQTFALESDLAKELGQQLIGAAEAGFDRPKAN
jgi:hypothetical protein